MRPRLLGLLGLVLVVGAAFVWLGRWQLGVAESTAHREAVEQARAQSPAELTSVLQPHAPFREDLSSRPVTASGRYAASGQLLVPDRRLDGTTGLWVLTPFVVDGSGATLPVVRGFVEDEADAGPPPEGPLRIAGGVAPGESPEEPARAARARSARSTCRCSSTPGRVTCTTRSSSSSRETPATGPQLHEGAHAAGRDGHPLAQRGIRPAVVDLRGLRALALGPDGARRGPPGGRRRTPAVPRGEQWVA